MTQETFPQTYVKGNQTRVIRNVRDRVKAKFDGFVLLGAGAGQVDYADLQAQAKERGIPANQSRAALVEALSRVGEPAESAAPAQPDELAEDPAPATPDEV